MFLPSNRKVVKEEQQHKIRFDFLCSQLVIRTHGFLSRYSGHVIEQKILLSFLASLLHRYSHVQLHGQLKDASAITVKRIQRNIIQFL